MLESMADLQLGIGQQRTRVQSDKAEHHRCLSVVQLVQAKEPRRLGQVQSETCEV